jgi:hypothetical protein
LCAVTEVFSTPAKRKKASPGKMNISLNSSVSIHDESNDFIPPTPPKERNTPRGRRTPKSVSKTQRFKHKQTNKMGHQSGVQSGNFCENEKVTIRTPKLNKSNRTKNRTDCRETTPEGYKPASRGLNLIDTMEDSPGLNRAMDEAVIMDVSEDLIDTTGSPIPGGSRAQNPQEMSPLDSFQAMDKHNEFVPNSEADMLPCTNSSFTIIDVASDKKLFKTFLSELKTKKWFAVSLACDSVQTEPSTRPGVGIGAKFTKCELLCFFQPFMFNSSF